MSSNWKRALSWKRVLALAAFNTLAGATFLLVWIVASDKPPDPVLYLVVIVISGAVFLDRWDKEAVRALRSRTDDDDDYGPVDPPTR